MINDKPLAFGIFSFFSKNGFENAFRSPMPLRTKASFRVEGGFQFAFKKRLMHSLLFPEGETADLQASQRPYAF